MFTPGDIFSYADMCNAEGYQITKGMNFRSKNERSVFLMSLRGNAPYNDNVKEGGTILIYEGHDIPRHQAAEPKRTDQQRITSSGALTNNGKFEKVALAFKEGVGVAELVHVYEKIRKNIWTYNGLFELLDVWTETSNNRLVFKFKLKITEKSWSQKQNNVAQEHHRIIPTHVMKEVFKRDNGSCVKCGERKNIHFDHIIPYSKGGTSTDPKNIQILCAKHNLQKGAKIQSY